MKFLKRNCIFLSIVTLLFGCGTNQQNKTDKLQLTERYRVIELFYQAYDKKDYKKMYEYLTPEMKKDISKQIKSIPRAKLISINKDNSQTWDGEYWINIDLEIETTQSSSLYPDTTWRLYLLTEKINNKWIITNFTTG